MSGDWNSYPNYDNQPYYHPQHPQAPYSQPHQQPVHYQQQPVQAFDPQYQNYQQPPPEYHYPIQEVHQQVQPHQLMPNRPHIPQEQPQDFNLRRSTRAQTQPPPPPPHQQHAVPASVQPPRRSKTNVNYTEPDESFLEDQADYMNQSRTTRSGRGQQRSRGGYEDDGAFQPDPTVQYQAQQQAMANGGIDPTVTSNVLKKEEDVEDEPLRRTGGAPSRPRRQGVKPSIIVSDEDEDDDEVVTKPLKPSNYKKSDVFLAEEDDEDDENIGDDSFGSRPRRLTRERAAELGKKQGKKEKKSSKKHKSKKRHGDESEEEYIEDSDEDSQEDLSEEELHRTSPSVASEDEEGVSKGPPKLRSRNGQPTNYNEIAAFERMEQMGVASTKKKPKREKMNWTGKDYEAAWGPLPGQSDTDSDAGKTPKKPGTLPGAPGGGMLAGGAGLPLDLAGTPSNLGRIGDAGLADADPLGVNTNVSFDDVGGLDEHVSKLKEMTLLPLLYPDMFQSLGVTPPRGVLFHGPPGTGKTLVARALAASCRSEGRSISFFMRKGADCLSKWVGEAERQLRLLFEEAKRSQPSIIFFDEIDGLAPVRSSKQDQIHASIVSTLLALMDGMDGRGQVIVIGATNRPDAIDPALRRPGRFDREFYFPLPNYEARLKILEIMTKQWGNWKGEHGTEPRQKLAKLTKGYGGADLRALCTEAALNAIQRQYPQIYQSSERLLLDHSKISVQARDFMISVKEVVASSARSSASAAAPLPPQLVPLLDQPLQEVKEVLDKVLPRSRKRTALEEAQWEEDHPDGEAGAFEREMMLQALETQRVNRPRLLLHGPPSMGQRAVGAAALHHLEGFSVQSFDLGTLTGDSARTPEAAIVQLFIEARRHAPSIIYIPSLTALSSSLPETCRTLVSDTLDSLEPHTPILLIAVLSGSFKSLPRDVRSWFGKVNGARILFTTPDEPKRRAFFQELLDYVNKPPTQFPDAVKRRRRVLEVLPVAPPLPPREPSEAEVKAQEEHDRHLFNKLKTHLRSIFSQCRKADSKFCRATIGETFGNVHGNGSWWGRLRAVEPGTSLKPIVKETVVTASVDPINGDSTTALVVQETSIAITTENGAGADAEVKFGRNKLHDIDMPRIEDWIAEGRFLTSSEFLHSIHRIRQNAEMEKNDDVPESKDMFRRADKVYGVALEEVGRTEPMFNLETERMAVRFRTRARKLQEKKEQEEKEAAAKAAAEANAGTANGQDTLVGLLSPKDEDRMALKRIRDDEMQDSDGSQPPSKRMRVSPFGDANEKSVRFADIPEPTLPAISVNGNTIPDSDMADAFDPPSPSPAGKRSTTSLGEPADPSKPNTDMAPLGLTQKVIYTPSRTPSPGPSTPAEFHASPDLVTKLEATLASQTTNLDIEQLEALRALCLNLLWKHRADWDRDPLINAMLDAINDYLREIGEVSEEEE